MVQRILQLEAISYNFETELIQQGYKYIAGTDEAGAGSLIGPVVAAAVILDENNLNYDIKDSKKLSAKTREKLSDWIKENSIAWAIGINSVKRIDEINILWARLEAMKLAVEKLEIKPDYILVDGDKLVPKLNYNQKAIIKGDDISYSIAAASIIAKVHRDAMLAEIGKSNLDYGLASNKGYWCKKVVEQIKKEGYRKGFHRKVFVRKILGEQK